MIIGNIKDAKRYFGINPNFEKAFEFLQTLSADSATGPFESDGFKGNISVIPEDAHAPAMCVGSAGNVKKAVVKIKDKFTQ